MKLRAHLSPEQVALLRTSTADPVPLALDVRIIGSCYAEMTPTGVQMVAEMNGESTSAAPEIGTLPEPFVKQTEIKKTFKPERKKRHR